MGRVRNAFRVAGIGHPTEGTWLAMKLPIKFAKTLASIRRDPPKIGQNNDEF